jgi:hypothetical protein
MFRTHHAAMMIWRAIDGVRGMAAASRPLVGRVYAQLAKRRCAAVCPEAI